MNQIERQSLRTICIVDTCIVYLRTGILFWLVQKLKFLEHKTRLTRVCAGRIRSALGLVVLTHLISPTPWTRPQTHPRPSNPHDLDQSISNNTCFFKHQLLNTQKRNLKTKTRPWEGTFLWLRCMYLQAVKVDGLCLSYRK